MNKVFSVISCFIVISIANNPDSLLPHKSTEIYNATSECSVTTFSNITSKVVNIFGLSDTTINNSKENLSKEILIKDIHSIKFKGGGFRNGALIRAGSALVLGYITIALADTADEEFKNALSFLTDSW